MHAVRGFLFLNKSCFVNVLRKMTRINAFSKRFLNIQQFEVVAGEKIADKYKNLRKNIFNEKLILL